mgnify:CR=1 FL=1
MGRACTPPQRRSRAQRTSLNRRGGAGWAPFCLKKCQPSGVARAREPSTSDGQAGQLHLSSEGDEDEVPSSQSTQVTRSSADIWRWRWRARLQTSSSSTLSRCTRQLSNGDHRRPRREAPQQGIWNDRVIVGELAWQEGRPWHGQYLVPLFEALVHVKRLELRIFDLEIPLGTFDRIRDPIGSHIQLESLFQGWLPGLDHYRLETDGRDGNSFQTSLITRDEWQAISPHSFICRDGPPSTSHFQHPS